MNGNDEALKQLAAPARNKYFYGKLLDVMHFEMEQRYMNRKRWLLNRLSVGTGVLCGLEVVVADDGQCLWIRPGVAVDPLGREIIVPEPYCLENIRQPTDHNGRPDGDPIAGEGVVTICLYYHECEVEPVPVLVGDCDTRQECANSTIRERFRLQIRANAPATEPGQISDEACHTIFPRGEVDDDFPHRQVACETLSGACAEPDQACVVLATVALAADETAAVEVDLCGYRTAVYSNTMLADLLMCLAARVDECCRMRLLRYVSGDGQVGEPGADLPEPLVVELLDGNGDLVADEPVTFAVRVGGGVVTPASVNTDAIGQASANWQLGAAPGLNVVEASVEGGSHVLFHASAQLPVRDLQYVSGDAQTASPGETLSEPIVVAVVDEDGNGVADETVTFAVRGGGGQLADASVVTDAAGRAANEWRLGAAAGLNTAVAAIANGDEVLFHALSFPQEEPPTTNPPVVNAIWVPNAASLTPRGDDELLRRWFNLWVESPRLEVTFDRRMNEEQLNEVDPWLRLWQIRSFGQNEIRVRRLPLGLADITEDSIVGEAGITAVYRLLVDDIGELINCRFLVQMRSRGGAIVDTSTPPLQLDAEFNGTRLTGAQLNQIWDIDEQMMGQTIWDRLVDTGAVLPRSGDGVEGGNFNSWFEVFEEGPVG
jgi:hypothetical protein